MGGPGLGIAGLNWKGVRGIGRMVSGLGVGGCSSGFYENPQGKSLGDYGWLDTFNTLAWLLLSGRAV